MKHLVLALVIGTPGLLIALVSWWATRAEVKVQPEPVRHPAHGRFCHICGADSFKNENCDIGLHG